MPALGRRRQRRPQRQPRSRSSPSDERLSLVNVDTPPRRPTRPSFRLSGSTSPSTPGEGFVQVVAGPDDIETARDRGLRLRRAGPRPRRAERPPARRRGRVRGRGPGVGAAERPHHLPQALRLQRGAEGARGPELRTSSSRSRCRSQTYEGRPVEGIEITTNPRRESGKPVFLQMGIHHAREWPSGEHAMEWAYELINGYRAGDPRVVNLVENTRTIIVPVVNPDGFNISREAGETSRAGGGIGRATTPSTSSARRSSTGARTAASSTRLRRVATASSRRLDSPSRAWTRTATTAACGAATARAPIPWPRTTAAPGRSPSPRPQNIQSLISDNQVTR